MVSNQGDDVRLIQKLAIAVGLAVGLAACATENYTATSNLRRDTRQPRILMMPPDVELSELDSSGTQMVNALWTRQAGTYLGEAVKARLSGLKAQYAEYQPPADDTPEAEMLHQIQQLHGAVGTTIRSYHFDMTNRLPSKGGRFDWSLGPEAQALGQHADADYALFLYVRDSYSTPGRIALRVAAAALTGVDIRGGTQLGHASLVDLKTGQVVWFNALFKRDKGDLRNAGDAHETVALLLDNLPK